MPENNVSMLTPAQNKMAYAKVGIYGSAATGKSRTATEIAIGLYRYANLDKPVCIFDTEGGGSFLKPLFDKAGIPLVIYDESRSFSDLLRFTDQVEQGGSILICDSITHIWKDLQSSYLTKINQSRIQKNQKKVSSLEFHHWGPIKAEWSLFTDRFLTSKVHFIICGRAGSVYEYQLNDRNNKMELITTGTKMQTEKELGHEPSLLIEMVTEKKESKIINKAICVKDRSDNYNGLEIAMPTFDSFIKHFEFLNIGGQHLAPMNQHDSSERFDEDGNDGWAQEKRLRDIYSEEIKSLFIRVGLDGTGAAVKVQRNDLLYETFGSGSWTSICSMKSHQIQNGFNLLKDKLEPNTDSEMASEDIPQ